MKTMTKLFVILIALCAFLPIRAQVTIGSNYIPNQGSLLDLKQEDAVGANSKKGLLLPRVLLEELESLAPAYTGSDPAEIEAHTGLVVYNMKEDLPKGLCKGTYVWQSSAWVRLPQPCDAFVDPELINSPNSYIVASGASVTIPVGKPYLVWNNTASLGNVKLSGIVTVGLIWQDTQSLIEDVSLLGGDKGPISELQVKSANAKTGNALVGVWVGPNGNKTDPLRWSWHIWVTDYDPNNNANGTTYAHNNGEKDYLFMDRNLGATTVTATDTKAMGLLYQWGRKDPFTSANYFSYDGSEDINGYIPNKLYDINNTQLTEVNELSSSNPIGTGITHANVTQSQNLGSAIKNPTIFYYWPDRSDDDEFEEGADWYTNSTTGSGDLWSATGTKSVFDPCPAGWRVPAYSSANKSPWALFEAVDDGWGWGDPVSDVTFGDTGAIYTAKAGRTTLGSYPYGVFRRPRAYNEYCGPVGVTNPSYYAGGLFAGCNLDGNQRIALYWTATPSANSLQAKGEYTYYSDSGLGDGGSILPKDKAKSSGGFVRCVKE